eukprot:176161-Pelagomonas_calceolata.AAC.1
MHSLVSPGMTPLRSTDHPRSALLSRGTSSSLTPGPHISHEALHHLTPGRHISYEALHHLSPP